MERRGQTKKDDGLVADSAEIELKRGNAGHFPALFFVLAERANV